ncbi:MAG: hypothetical protein AB1589_01550 [Cyanobacteriota bacterium]
MMPKRFPALAVTLITTAAILLATVVLSADGLSANPTAGKLRVRSQTGYQENQIEFKRVEYVGQCPGTDISSSSLSSEFVSETTPPAPGRRVIIRNVTQGMNSDPYPFTDREYEKGQASESFKFGISDRHRSQSLSVFEGKNQFEYEIRDKNTAIEQGTLTVDVAVKDMGVFPREAICSDQVQCRDESVDCGKNDDGSRRRGKRQRCYTTTNCQCPS